MKTLIPMVALAMLAVAATPAHAVVRGSAGASKYTLGGGSCLYFQGVRFWIAPC